MSAHLWFVIRWAEHQNYTLKCTACGAEETVEVEDAEASYGGSLVRRFDRYSAKVAAVLGFLAILAISALATRS